jgi:hypothetical protein
MLLAQQIVSGQSGFELQLSGQNDHRNDARDGYYRCLRLWIVNISTAARPNLLVAVVCGGREGGRCDDVQR